MFCAWLKKNRRELGLTQRSLGNAAGLSPSALGMYEQGRRVPGPAAAARLRDFFLRRGLAMPPVPPQPERQGERPLLWELRAASAIRLPESSTAPPAPGKGR